VAKNDDLKALARKLEELFDAYLTQKSKGEATKERLAAHEAKKPARPAHFESVWDLVSHQENWRAHQDREVALRETLDAVSEELAHVSDEIKKRLPTETWVRYGDVGFGVSVTNWGGYHTSLQVEPWADEMPSLDHRYRGD